METDTGIDLRKSVLSGADFEDASLIASGDITFSYSGASDTTFTNAHLHAGNNLIFNYAYVELGVRRRVPPRGEQSSAMSFAGLAAGANFDTTDALSSPR